jgi:hypothetical protein
MILVYFLVIVIVISIGWVKGIGNMYEKYPDYNGEDLFGEDEIDTNEK